MTEKAGMSRATFVVVVLLFAIAVGLGYVAGNHRLLSPQKIASWLSRHQADQESGGHAGRSDAAGGHAASSPFAVNPFTGERHDQEVVVLSPQAYRNLGLKEATVQLESYWRNVRVPASVMERPGVTNHAIAAPVNGMVGRLFAVPGQAVSPGSPLVQLKVTDEEVSQAQLDLLQDLNRLDVIAAELARLKPLASAGTAARQIRELTYEQQQLLAKKQLHQQELLVRGLNETQVRQILTTRELVREMTVRLAHRHAAGDVHHDHTHGDLSLLISVDDLRKNNDAHPEAENGPAEPATVDLPYTVESVAALPGTIVQRGDTLCQMAYHAELFLHAQIFDNELSSVTRAHKENWKAIAEFGLKDSVFERTDLPIEYIDNHVNSADQTYSLYLRLTNEVVHQSTNIEGAPFRTWRFKPGQRAYVRIPVEQWEDQIVVPSDAVTADGPEMFVFRRHDHGNSGSDATSLDEGELTDDEPIEFERVPVRVLHRDTRQLVLAAGEQIKTGDTIALNSAYQLNLAIKMAEGSGGGHSHDHPH